MSAWFPRRGASSRNSGTAQHYVPLNPAGALPPGLEAGLLKAALKQVGVTPIRALRLLGVRHMAENPANRLREVLDDPAARLLLDQALVSCSPEQRPRLCVVLYRYACRMVFHGGVYSSVIKPAETEDEHHVRSLDPEVFRDRVAAQAEDLVVESLEDRRSDAAVLALFVVAYGIYQPEDAPHFVEAVTGLGEPFKDYLGVDWDPPEVKIERTVDDSDGSDIPQGTDLPKAPLGASIASEVADTTTESEQIVIAARRPSEIIPKSADGLSPFDIAEQEQLAAGRKLRRIGDSAEGLAAEFGLRLVFGVTEREGCTREQRLEIAEADLGELEVTARRLRLALATDACDLEPLRPQLPKRALTSLKQLGELLEGRLERLEILATYHDEWDENRERILGILQDCSESRSSRSLASLRRRDARSLVCGALFDAGMVELVPGFIRLWAELSRWSEDGVPKPDALLLTELFDRAAQDDDWERYYALLGWLDAAQIQSLLGSDGERLRRHVVLVSFCQGAAHTDPSFFTSIWVYPEWDRRQVDVGSHLASLFDQLQDIYRRTGRYGPILEGLSGAGAIEDEESRLLHRSAEAKEWAQRLRFSTGSAGNYRRLRVIACTRLFQSVSDLLSQGREGAAASMVQRLLADHAKGTLVKQVVGDYSEQYREPGRRLREDHVAGLQRFISDRLGKLSDWLTVPATESAHDVPAQVADAVRRVHSLLRHRGADLEVGSIEWLEAQLSDLLEAARIGDTPTATEPFASLASTSTDWLASFSPDPKIPWLWVCQVDGNPTWRDRLQISVAASSICQPLTIEEAVERLWDDQRIEEIAELLQYSGIDLPSTVRQRASAASDLMRRRAEAVALFDRLESQSAELEPRNASRDSLDEMLLRCLVRLDGWNINAAFDDLADAEALLAKVTRVTAPLESDKARARRAWLAACDIELPEGTSLRELEESINRTKKDNSARRTHISSLRKLRRDAPPELTTAISRTIRRLDHPGEWPGPDGANNAEVHVELLREALSDWWASLRTLDPIEAPALRVRELIKLLSAKLETEVVALKSEPPSPAPLTSYLIEDAPTSITATYADLVARGLLEDATGLVEVTEGLETTTGREFSEPERIIDARWTLRSEDSAALNWQGLRSTLHTCLQSENAQELERAAAHEIAHPGSGLPRGLLIGLLGWSKSQHVPDSDAEQRAAIALLLRQRRIILENSILQADQLAEWVIRLLGGRVPDDGVGTSERMYRALIRLRDLDASDPERRNFARLARWAGDGLADACWESLSGHDLAAEPRAALLGLLFDAGQDECLQRFFCRLDRQLHVLLRSFVQLARTALTSASRIATANLPQLARRIEQSTSNRAIRRFVTDLVQRVGLPATQVAVAVEQELEPTDRTDVYLLHMTLAPDDMDMPLNLSVELHGTTDLKATDGESCKVLVSNDLMTQEIETHFKVTLRDARSAQRVVLSTTGDTVSGNSIDQKAEFEVRLSTVGAYKPLDSQTVLDMYPGHEGNPVRGDEFVGRENELSTLSRLFRGDRVGAAILYGARRLGKTSLLDELRRRHCCSRDHRSRVLFVSVPVDLFEVRQAGDSFLPKFLKHIRDCLADDPANEHARTFLNANGVNARRLAEAAKGLNKEAPFLLQLNGYITNIQAGCADAFDSVVLVFDEFDKLLEAYRLDLRQYVEELVNQLRRAATEYPNLGILLAGSDLMRLILEQYRSALYGSASIIELEGLDSPDEARAIIAPERLMGKRRFRQRVVERIVSMAGGHPLYMRTIAMASALTAKSTFVTEGTALTAAQDLIGGRVLTGYIPEFRNLVLQPLQSLAILEEGLDATLARLLLLRTAVHTSLDGPDVVWGSLMQDDKLLTFGIAAKWIRLRDQLMVARLLKDGGSARWTFRFPVLAEALRQRADYEQERLVSQLEAERPAVR